MIDIFKFRWMSFYLSKIGFKLHISVYSCVTGGQGNPTWKSARTATCSYKERALDFVSDY